MRLKLISRKSLFKVNILIPTSYSSYNLNLFQKYFNLGNKSILTFQYR